MDPSLIAVVPDRPCLTYWTKLDTVSVGTSTHCSALTIGMGHIRLERLFSWPWSKIDVGTSHGRFESTTSLESRSRSAEPKWIKRSVVIQHCWTPHHYQNHYQTVSRSVPNCGPCPRGHLQQTVPLSGPGPQNATSVCRPSVGQLAKETFPN